MKFDIKFLFAVNSVAHKTTVVSYSVSQKLRLLSLRTDVLVFAEDVLRVCTVSMCAFVCMGEEYFEMKAKRDSHK